MVNINPVQDLHGQDAPYPAGGGVNLLDPSKCSTIGPGGAYGLTVTHDQATAIWTISGTPTSQNASLSFNFCTYSDFSLSGKGYQIQAFPISGTPIKNIYGFRNETESRIAIIIDTVANPTVNVTFKVSVAATAQTAWSPYSNICPISGWTGMQLNANGTVIHINWQTEAGTVYGGKLDVLSGKLTVTFIESSALDAWNWAYYASGEYFYAVPPKRFTNSEIGIGMWDRYKYFGNNKGSYLQDNMPDMNFGFTNASGQKYIYVKDFRFDNAADFKASFAGSQIIYTMSEDNWVEIQLTPHEVNSLLGVNNIFADTGDTACEYRADPDLYIQRKMPEVPVDDVQINGTSIVTDGVANIPMPKTVNVSGTTPTITAQADTRYICGEVLSLDFTPSATGICDVVFTSGATATVLTVPSTIKWANGFDPTSLDANTTYELNIMDGLGVVMAWT